MQLDLFEPSPDPDPQAPVASPAEPGMEGETHALRRELERQSKLRVDLVVTDNSSTIMSVKHLHKGAVARLRVHRMFLDAPMPVVHALAAWITLRRNPSAAAILNEYIRDQQHRIRRREPVRRRIVTKGEHFDLEELFRDVNASHFQNRVDAAITWGRSSSTKQRRSVTFGSYSQQDHLIRINPLLDRSFVPQYFIRFIVFHEMLHADLGIDESSTGRRRAHTREFRRIEQAHPDYRRVMAWQETHLGRFLRPKSY